MNRKTFEVVPIRKGTYSEIEWVYGTSVLAALPFLSTGRILVHFKNEETDAAPAAVIDTQTEPSLVSRTLNGDGTLTFKLKLPSVKTVNFRSPYVKFDVIVFDGTEPHYVSGRWTWAVAVPVTTVV